MKPLTLRIVLLLLLVSGGAVTTVAVAWGLAYWNHRNLLAATLAETRLVDDPKRPWIVSVDTRGFGSELVYLTAAWPKRDLPDWPVPAWFDFRHLGPDDLQLRGLAAGYPCKSLRSFMLSAWPPPVEAPYSSMRGLENRWVGAIRLDQRPDGALFKVLPCDPIWPGFLIDTLLYAVVWGAIWFGLFFGFASARRALRRRRGHCPKCNYDLRGELDKGCSECGWGRT